MFYSFIKQAEIIALFTLDKSEVYTTFPFLSVENCDCKGVKAVDEHSASSFTLSFHHCPAHIQSSNFYEKLTPYH